MKKVFGSILIFLTLLTSSYSLDFLFRLMPSFDLIMGSSIKNGFTGELSFDVAPFTVRNTDKIYFSMQGSINQLNADSRDSVKIYEADFSTGYTFRPIDRFSMGVEGGIGIWYTGAYEKNINYAYEALSGLSFGGKLLLNYYLSPGFQIGTYVGYKTLYYKPEPLVKNEVRIGLNLQSNLSQGVFSKPQVTITEKSVDVVYPVFYSRYNEHEFGQLSFINEEENSIKDVEISVYVEKYMSNPKVISSISEMKMGEEVEIPITAFFSNTILENLTNSNADLLVTIKYKSLGKQIQVENILDLQTLSRNSMNWNDDRQAAVFASGKDSAAYEFAHRTVSVIKNNLKEGVPINIQYASALFAALKAFGINYVIDPSSAFTDNVGTSSVDFLQFPYQTILYHGGDCDDLSILNCSLLESIGIDTAFITVPGHIYIAFDSGVSVSEAKEVLTNGKYIVFENQVWIPLEITLSQDTFKLALDTGYKQWEKAGNQAALIPIKKAWKEFKPISVSASNIDVDYPETDLVIKYFNQD